MILGSVCSKTPLWLYLVCEELRIYGDFRTLSSHIQSLTTSLEAAIKHIVDRLISEDDTGCLKKVWYVCLITFQLGCVVQLGRES